MWVIDPYYKNDLIPKAIRFTGRWYFAEDMLCMEVQIGHCSNEWRGEIVGYEDKVFYTSRFWSSKLEETKVRGPIKKWVSKEIFTIEGVLFVDSDKIIEDIEECSYYD